MFMAATVMGTAGMPAVHGSKVVGCHSKVNDCVSNDLCAGKMPTQSSMDAAYATYCADNRACATSLISAAAAADTTLYPFSAMFAGGADTKTIFSATNFTAGANGIPDTCEFLSASVPMPKTCSITTTTTAAPTTQAPSTAAPTTSTPSTSVPSTADASTAEPATTEPAATEASTQASSATGLFTGMTVILCVMASFF